MNRPKAVRVCIWGGIAAVLIGILIFGVGYVITATAPFYPYGPPRGAPVAWLGLITVVLGIGMTAAGAVMKAVGAGAELLTATGRGMTQTANRMEREHRTSRREGKEIPSTVTLCQEGLERWEQTKRLTMESFTEKFTEE